MALPRYLYSVSESVRSPLLRLEQSPTTPAVSRPLELANTAVSMETDVTTSVELTRTASQEEIHRVERDLELGGVYKQSSHEMSAVVENGDSANSLAKTANGNSQYGGTVHQPSITASVKKKGAINLDPGDCVYYKADQERTKWEEAALYVREGEDNDKFPYHPRGKWSRHAYTVLHHPAYYITHLTVGILLMLLALIEQPSVADKRLSEDQLRHLIIAHGVLELFFLLLLAADISLRLLWLQPRHFFKHKRTMLISIILVVMFVEAITVLVRQESHLRITRALRPVFFIDNFLMGGVRRVLRQILECIKPITDVLLLLLFFVIFFSLFGYYIFADIDTTYFDTYGRSFVSLFISTTTANHPDVMLGSYSQYPATPIFFIVYIVVALYFISNMLLAVVYSSFSDADKNKFRKLFLHKREALRHAYNVISGAEGIEFHDFLLFMQQYQPAIPEWQTMCIFKALHKDPKQQHQDLSLDEFYSFYEMQDFRWKRLDSEGIIVPWFIHHGLPSKLRKLVKPIHKLVKLRWFNLAVNLIVGINLLFLLIYTALISEAGERFEALKTVRPVSFVFVLIYCIEIILRIIGLGPVDYFRKFWSVGDFIVILVSLVCLCLESSDALFPVVVCFRPLKLIRLLKLKRRYRDIMNTLLVLTPRLLSVGLLLLVIYYFFAVMGMEFFAHDVYPGCCNTSWYGIGQLYAGPANSSSLNSTDGIVNMYYLNNFDNILRSYVTLYVLMVVNNWFIIMEGFASEAGKYEWGARLYFMMFYIITLVVLQVVISFIVEAFVFKIQATQKKRSCEKHKDATSCECVRVAQRKKLVQIHLVTADIIKLKYEIAYSDQTCRTKDPNYFMRRWRRVDLDHSHLPEGVFQYTGRRLRTKEDIHLLMYKSVLQNWIDEQEVRRSQQIESTPRQPCHLIAWNYFKNAVEYVLE